MLPQLLADPMGCGIESDRTWPAGSFDESRSGRAFRRGAARAMARLVAADAPAGLTRAAWTIALRECGRFRWGAVPAQAGGSLRAEAPPSRTSNFRFMRRPS
ncbi:hypothetical protein [Lysobacter gummosus]|uniref:hypothetical protein n=1 Tax=Lysobacter gummosus TaxID=262324 RepID=UPI00363F4E03